MASAVFFLKKKKNKRKKKLLVMHLHYIRKLRLQFINKAEKRLQPMNKILIIGAPFFIYLLIWVKEIPFCHIQ